MNMQNALSVSVTHVLPLVSVARCIGILFTDRILGTGMYIPTVCMLMRFRHSVIRFGGIGATVLTVGDGTMAGDGVLIMLGGIIRAIGAVGMVATGVAGMAAVIGDITTIGMALPFGVVVIGPVRLIPIVVLMGKAVIEILLRFVVTVQVPERVPPFVEGMLSVGKGALSVLPALLIAEVLRPGVW